MGKVIQPHELSEEIKAMIRKKFDAYPRVRELNVRAHRLQQAGDYMGALQVRKQIEQFFDKAIVAYCAEAERQVVEVDGDTLRMPPEDKAKINTLMVAMYMAVDIMDSCLMDINDTLHKTDKNLNYEKILDLKEMAHLCREQLMVFGTQADYLQYAQWGDITDNMYAMIQSKAKAVINKIEKEKCQ